MRPRHYFALNFVLVMLLTAFFCWRPLGGGVDFWAHAAVGKWIASHHAIPHQTLFLWSAHTPWIAHSWLSQLIFYELIQHGAATVLLFCAALNGLMFALIWWLWSRMGKISVFTPLVFAFAIWCAQARFNPRPEMFSAFLTVLLLAVLALHEKKYVRSRHLFWLIPGFILWTNLHGGVAMGLALLLVTLIAEAAQNLSQKQSLRPALILGAVLLGCIAALLVNPFGWHYFRAFTQVGGPMFALIDEWKSPFISPTLPPEALLALFILAATAFICWIGNAERKWSHLGWLLLALLMFVQARRNLELLSLVSLIVIAVNPDLLQKSFGGTLQRWLPAFATVYVVIMLVSAIPPLPLNPLSPLLPRGVADTVLKEQQAQPHLRIFNDYLTSSYFQWRFAGRPPLYIDLLNAYPASLLSDYFQIIHADAAGLKKFNQLHVDLVAFGPYTSTNRQYPLAHYLDNSAQWKRIYNDKDGSVWKFQGNTKLALPSSSSLESRDAPHRD